MAYLLRTTYRSQSTTYYLLFLPYCFLPTAHCLLLPTYCCLPTAYLEHREGGEESDDKGGLAREWKWWACWSKNNSSIGVGSSSVKTTETSSTWATTVGLHHVDARGNPFRLARRGARHTYEDGARLSVASASRLGRSLERSGNGHTPHSSCQLALFKCGGDGGTTRTSPCPTSQGRGTSTCLCCSLDSCLGGAASGLIVSL